VNPELTAYLAAADEALKRPSANGYCGPVHVGVDLGTAYTTLFVLDEAYRPLIGAYRFAEVVRDGLVVDFAGATKLLRELKREVEGRLGFELTSAATTYPPGVPVRWRCARPLCGGVAGLECTGVVDEPTAANAVLQVTNGAVVDIGGGTTNIAVFADGCVLHTSVLAIGGIHITNDICYGLRAPFELPSRSRLATGTPSPTRCGPTRP